MQNIHPKHPKRISDIARPGTTPAHANSKPLLRSKAARHIDPTLTKRHQQTINNSLVPVRITLDVDAAENNERSAKPHLPAKQSQVVQSPEELEVIAQRLLQQPSLQTKKPKKKRSLIVLVLIILVVAMVAYDAKLVIEYLQLT